ncbi:DUF6807 domain-containing protein [Cyclobacterium marinum]|uniref:Methane oxygenase PmoA n=1 Tax=Cyclobacterium marinum (strain ATCC 25205 / DSM 745 / LMG 13164 / NCIMB 1802) TaxID=880070 RepID=G0J4F7_CYCMS|nr:PmoA family protein [Cyclobacterium marinum]AEL28397.1 hypothetical protein Cycma_4711 [Cyclobacterium marinum DSM 745]
MKFNLLICALIACLLPLVGVGQTIAKISLEEVEPSKFAYPVTIDLNSITELQDSLLIMVNISEEKPYEVPFQLDNLNGRKLTWMVKPKEGQTSYSFELRKKNRKGVSDVFFSLDLNETALVVKKEGLDLWQYNHGLTMPPEGVAPAYARSGFVHPMRTPEGLSLTRIQPSDHYHHYGLWNPWTRVGYKNDTIDFWNLNDKQGTVRFANYVNRTSGPVYADYKVLHEHVVLKDRTEPEVAFSEVQGVRIFAEKENDEYYLADISIVLNTNPDDSIVLQEYRYGSLGWRATELWNRYNSEVITSEGLDRKSADGSLARWCIVQGELGDDFGAVVMMSFPANFNHPEPLRIWPEDIYDKGDIYANFAPTKNKNWVLEAGKAYQLNYRFLVSSKKISPEEAEAAWNQFAKPPKITINKL